MNGDYAVIPVREFATTKLRLKEVLSTEKRVALTAALLKRVVRALERSQIEHVVVVATDTIEAALCLHRISKVTVIPEKMHHGGVIEAMRVGIDFSIGREAKTVTMLPSDLPLITHSKINEALDILRQRDLIINPSLREDGTNLLAMKTSLKFELHYDDDSYVKHLQEARSMGLNFQSLNWREFSNDLDDASDLERAMIFYDSKRLVDFLEKISSIKI